MGEGDVVLITILFVNSSPSLALRKVTLGRINYGVGVNKIQSLIGHFKRRIRAQSHYSHESISGLLYCLQKARPFVIG